MAIKITPYVGGGVDIFTTKKDNEGAYLGTEETFGFHANNGLLYIEGAAVVSQTRKDISGQKTDAQMDRYGLDVSAGAELRLKNIGISLGPYAEMGIMRGQAPFGSGLSDPFVTTNTYVGAGAQLGLDFVMKGKKIDFTAGIRGRAGYRSIGVSSIYFNNNISHSVGGSAFGAGLRFSIGPGTISDDTEAEPTESEEEVIEEGGQPVEGVPVDGAAPAGGEAPPAEGATPAPGAAPAAPGRTPVAPRTPGGGAAVPVAPVVPGVPGAPGATPVVPPGQEKKSAQTHPDFERIKSGRDLNFLNGYQYTADSGLYTSTIKGRVYAPNLKGGFDAIFAGTNAAVFSRLPNVISGSVKPIGSRKVQYVVKTTVNEIASILPDTSGYAILVPPLTEKSDGSFTSTWSNTSPQPDTAGSTFEKNQGSWTFIPDPEYKDIFILIVKTETIVKMSGTVRAIVNGLAPEKTKAVAKRGAEEHIAFVRGQANALASFGG